MRGNPLHVVERERDPASDDQCVECGDELPARVHAIAGGRRYQRAAFCTLNCISDYLWEQCEDDNEGRISKRAASDLILQLGLRGAQSNDAAYIAAQRARRG